MSSTNNSTVNQRKNRNLYTSIGNYNTNGAKAGSTSGNMNMSVMMTDQSIVNHSSLVALNQSLGN